MTTDIADAATTRPSPRHIEAAAGVLGAVVVFSSAFHFWPFPGVRAWELLLPANAAILLWLALLAAKSVADRSLSAFAELLPRTSVLACLCAIGLSGLVAPDAGRAATYIAKLLLAYVGGYTLFRCAGRTETGRRALYGAAFVAAVVAVAGSLVTNAFAGAATFGFFGDGHKYGSYVGILVPLCAGVALAGRGRWPVMAAGMILIVAGAVSLGTLGGAAAVATGLTACLVMTRGAKARLSVLVAILLAAGAVAVLSHTAAGGLLRQDAAAMELDGRNCRQRYIDWQAMINLLADRGGLGSGPGCVNEFRSMYYHRLPKLNTLGPFEQNGWLGIAAETGVLGLICFCWVVWDYARLSLRSIRSCRAASPRSSARAIGNLGALAAACAANAFSSVHYNGIVILFVLVLALIANTEWSVQTDENVTQDGA